MPACRSCNANIEWIKTEAGKAMPLDPDYVTVVTDEGHVVRGRVSHFATCPNAQKHRKAKETEGGKPDAKPDANLLF